MRIPHHKVCLVVIVSCCLLSYILMSFSAFPCLTTSWMNFNMISRNIDTQTQVISNYSASTSLDVSTKVAVLFQQSSSTISSASVQHKKARSQMTDRKTELDVEVRFQKRLAMLRSGCRRHSDSSVLFSTNKWWSRIWTVSMIPFGANMSVTYCPIEKVSSTTWKMVIKSIYSAAGTNRKRLAKDTDITDSHARHASFLFVREPYARLLSAYVDKLFSPNGLYWHKTGQYIIKLLHNTTLNRRQSCGHDVTFSEFIKYFIHMQKTGKNRDGHFYPVHEHCQVCGHPYTYVGHLETVSEDMAFILKAIHSPVSYNKTYDNETIKLDIRFALRFMKSRGQSCMSLDEACRRIWKKWQIRGIISKTQSFPLTKKETRTISVAKFQQIGLDALKRAGDKAMRVKQKEEALKEAFASIPLKDRLQVKKLLYLDFELFGFNPDPDFVFPKTAYKSSFSYFDWKN